MSRDEWLEARKMGIGGSDAGAILGLNPYSSPTRVFLDKTGQAEPQADNYAMKIGRDLEDYVARLFTEETGKKVRRRNAMLINDSYPFAVANVDREVVGEKSLLECKTTSKLDPQDLRDGIAPDSYYCQCMHYLAVTGMERIYLAILYLSDPKTFEILEITRNDETIESLMECINGTYYQLGDAKNHIDDFLDRREYLENVIADAYDVIARTDEPHEVLQNLEIIEKAHKVLRLEREML